jgi:hypothetical protein
MSWFQSEKPKRAPKRKNEDPEEQSSNSAADRFSRSVLVAGIVVFAISAIGGLYQIFYWTFHTAPPPPTLSAYEIPTAQPTTGAIQPTVVWQDWNLLDVQAAMALRQSRNVVNLALVTENGQARFSDQSLVFTATSPWSRAQRPYGWETLTIQGTSISVESAGWSFPLRLNLLQPFIFESAASTIYLVSLDGVLWSLPSDQANWMSVADVAAQLPQELAANPQLSISLESR